MKIVTFGEIMLRLQPPHHQRFIQAQSFDAHFGGGEANVAASLALLNHHTYFVTRLPLNEIGQSALNSLRSLGIDTRHVVRGGERLGIYFIEKGASQRPSQVIYDRAYSSFSLSTLTDYDWEAIFQGVDWFHFTGITPALGENLILILNKALEVAKSKNIPVSCDLNYRKKLWSRARANEVMHLLMPYVDVLIANEEDAYDVFNIRAEHSNAHQGQLNHEAYIDVAKELINRYHFKQVAITLRTSISATENQWAGLLYVNNQSFFSRQYHLAVVDRVGGGDSFVAGLIHSSLKNFDFKTRIDFAVAASCLKHSIEGDINLSSEEEINRLMSGDGSGRVQR
jgi:2-dehydro-3-deoxygluconokinase